MPGSRAPQRAARIGNVIGAVHQAGPVTVHPGVGHKAMARAGVMIEIAAVLPVVRVDRPGADRIGNPGPRHRRCPTLECR